MQKVKELVVVTGTYQSAEGEKKRYQNIGSMLKRDDGTFCLKIDSLPISANWDGWVNLYEPKDRSQQRQQAAAPAPAPQQQYQAPLDDDIPF